MWMEVPDGSLLQGIQAEESLTLKRDNVII